MRVGQTDSSVLLLRQRMGLLEGRGSSRVVEACIHVAPAALLTELYTGFLRTNLAALAAHPTGNFVVQAFLAATREGAQVGSPESGRGSEGVSTPRATWSCRRSSPPRARAHRWGAQRVAVVQRELAPHGQLRRAGVPRRHARGRTGGEPREWPSGFKPWFRRS
jgi:hypothetical protein